MSQNQKPEFTEQFVSKHVEPTEPTRDFDYEAIYKAIDGDSLPEDFLTAEESKKLAIVLSRIIKWLVPKTASGERGLKSIGKRAVAFAWVVDPEKFQEGGASMTQVGTHFGMHKAVLSELTSEFSKVFQVRNKQQNHGWNYKNEKPTDSPAN